MTTHVAAEAEPLLVERHGHTLLLTMNRPHARNAVNLAMASALGDALADADTDPDVWVVALTGAGRVAFSAGGDLKTIQQGEPVAPMDERRKPWGFAGFVAHPISKPTIAAVNGFSLGGGTEIVLACDLAIASETASFGLPEVSRGIMAAAGGAFRLPAQIPKKLAMEMLLTGEPISAARALEVGLVNQVVTPDQLLASTMDLADRICRNAPKAVQVSKLIALGIEDGEIPSEREDWRRSLEWRSVLLASEDAREGMTAFAAKRPPRWVGR